MLNLEPGEEIVYTARKHWFIFAAESFFIVLFALLPASVFLAPGSVAESLKGFLPDGVPFGFLVLFLWSIWLILLWLILTLFWTDYYLDVWLVTNHRIIDVDQKGMFSRETSSFRFDQIQDATVNVPGILATLINFGNVLLRTASNETFAIKGVARPKVLKERILSEQHRIHGEKFKSDKKIG